MISIDLANVTAEDLGEAIETHKAAGSAWAHAVTADDVSAARWLSQIAARIAPLDGERREQLEAACIDAEAAHATDIHDQAAAQLRAACPLHTRA